MTALSFLVLSSVLLAAPAPAFSQVRDTATADQLVAAFLKHSDLKILTFAGWPCPATHHVQNYVFERLTSTVDHQEQVQRLAQVWGYALSECRDERIAMWYRRELGRATNPWTFFALGVSLAATSDSNNLAAIRAAISRADMPEELRGEVVSSVKSVSRTDRVIWIADDISRGRTYPRAYFENEYYFVADTARPRVRQALLGAVKSQAHNNSAVHALSLLIWDAGRDLAWRETLLRDLAELERRPDLTQLMRAIIRDTIAQFSRAR